MKRVMIIDAEEGVRQVMSVYAEMLDLEATLLDGLTACDLYSEPDSACSRNVPCALALVVDQNLGPEGMTGLDIIRMQQKRGCKLPARCKAVMARNFDTREFRQARTLGCHVLQKPVTFEIFEDWIRTLVSDTEEPGSQDC